MGAVELSRIQMLILILCLVYVQIQSFVSRRRQYCRVSVENPRSLQRHLQTTCPKSHSLVHPTAHLPVFLHKTTLLHWIKEGANEGKVGTHRFLISTDPRKAFLGIPWIWFSLRSLKHKKKKGKGGKKRETEFSRRRQLLQHTQKKRTV